MFCFGLVVFVGGLVFFNFNECFYGFVLVVLVVVCDVVGWSGWYLFVMVGELCDLFVV